jgi:hypothetical protein
MTKTVHIIGLRDGINTAGTGFLIRQLRALGATVTLAKTGRATVTINGQTTVYTVTAPTNRAEADAMGATGESPLSRALADLTKGSK